MASEQSQSSSCSPKETWEDWMEWAALSDLPPGKQFNSASTTVTDGLHKQRGFSSQTPSPTDSRNAFTRKRKASKNVAHAVSSPKDHGEITTSIQNRNHSLVEKRYRANLNDKIAELRQAVPSLRDHSSSQPDGRGSGIAHKHNKATTLTKAIEYIQLLEKRNAYLEDANNVLRSQVDPTPKAEDIDKTGVTENMSKSCDRVSASPPNMDQALVSEPCGAIPVPEDMKRLRTVPLQEHYADQFALDDTVESPFSGRVSLKGRRSIGRAVVGSLACLMIMDRLTGSCNEAECDRGLFALPIPSFVRLIQISWATVQALLEYVPHNSILVPLTRVLLVFSVLGLALFLYLFHSKPKLGKFTTESRTRYEDHFLSPINVRQNAWLTAIQTVWVPRHTMIPEMVALILETHAYMTRQILGWHSYSWVTGRNEDDEIARVRAWEIAIDAQLTGGDAEISRSRLVLTLWASGTLPNTPARLMLKALHIRILFFQASRYLWICRAFDSVARHLARKQWRLGQELINNPTVSKDPIGEDPLPDHLVALLQQPCDDIMNDSVILHAHNLAWNGSSIAYHSQSEADTHLEDMAMLGSLDLIAMRSSELTLQEALHAVLETSVTESWQAQIELALRIAPPGSLSSLRALAAAATFCEFDRQDTLSAALRPPSDFCLRSSLPPMTRLSTLPENISVAIDCARVMEIMVNSEDNLEALAKALQVVGHALSKVQSLDTLAFAITYHLGQKLMLLISENDHLMKTFAYEFNEHILGAIMKINNSPERQSVDSLPLYGICRRALNRTLLRRNLGRRTSNVSMDSGYGSVDDDGQRRY